MTKITPAQLVLCLVFALAVGAAAGCGGSGGGNDDPAPVIENVSFSGTLRDGRSSGPSEPIAATTVCALGSCGVTSDLGTWGFEVPDTAYSGGTVEFTINGPLVVARALVSGLSPAARTVAVEFVATTATTAEAVNVVQDSSPVATPTPTPDVVEDEPLSTDPQERACQILEQTNITITNIAGPVVHETGEACPEDLGTIAVVGNIHPIGFEYSLTSDAPDAIEISPATGTVQQGQLSKHDGAYLCTRNIDFVANVTARVIRYFPPDGVSITSDEAIALCGSGSDVGNTEETKQISVTIK